MLKHAVKYWYQNYIRSRNECEETYVKKLKALNNIR